jgi:phosphoglycerol geranylgeranyltransferase
MTLYQRLLEIRNKRGAGYFVLLDPDKQPIQDLVRLAQVCEKRGVDAILIGGSLLFAAAFDEMVRAIKKAVSIPIILFPGNGGQLSKHADGVLFMSIISGRNPHYLIGEQVLAAPIVRALDLEAISTGYMLVESGRTTSAEFMSSTRPLPREKPDIAVAHALAGEYLGMKLIYLEGGSGAKWSVPGDMILAVCQTIAVPVIVGGGIRTPDEALAKVQSGASFIVTGNVLEEQNDESVIQAFADAIHFKEKA